MSARDPIDSPPPEDDAYNESEDEDFDPDATVPEGNVTSEDEAEPEPEPIGKKAPKGKRKRGKKGDDEAEDVGFENSGDEAIVKRGTKRRKKQGDGDGDESGGEGGFVKTRRMRAEAAEEQSRRPLATTEGSTIDVEAIWAEMNDPTANKAPPPPLATVQEKDTMEIEQPQATGAAIRDPVEDMIEVEETYKFAGEVQVTKKLVPRSSEEGQKWLKEHVDTKAIAHSTDSASAATSKAKRHPDTGEPLLRPLRRVSLWDPNPAGIVKGMPANILSDTDAGNRLRVVDKSKLGWHTEAAAPKAPKATKLNVVEKSKMDWAAHVDAMGDKEDLEKAAKAKGSYLERRDFLERVEARKDDQERRVRVK